MLERIRSESLYLVGEGGNDFRKPGSLRGGNPFDGEPFGIDSEILENELRALSPGQCFVITIQVMTFAEVSAHDDDAVRSFAQGVNDQVGVNHAGAHDPDGA